MQHYAPELGLGHLEERDAEQVVHGVNCSKYDFPIVLTIPCPIVYATQGGLFWYPTASSGSPNTMPTCSGSDGAVVTVR